MALLLALAIVLGTGGQDPRPQPRDPVKKAAARLTASISGRVTDAESGRPVADAVVRAAAPASESQRAEAVTDLDGRYHLQHLAPGEYIVAAVPDLHRRAYRAAGFGIDDARAAVMASAPRVAVAAGEMRTDVDIRLPRARAIEGRISNTAGEPLADVIVRAEHTGVPSRTVEVRSDDRGLYRLYGLEPGPYRVCAQARSALQDLGGDASEPPYSTTCYSPDPADARKDEVVLDARDLEAVDIHMPLRDIAAAAAAGSGGATLRGRITDAGSGLPLPGAVVLVRSFAGEDRSYTTLTGSDGRYEVAGLAAGVWLVRAAAGHHRPSHAPRGYSASGVLRGASGIKIAEGEVRADIDIALPRAGAIGGRIVDEAGEPLSGIRVQLYHAPGGRPASRGASQASDDRGVFRLSGIEPGRYFLCIQPPVVIRSRGADSGLRRRAPGDACHPSAAHGDFGQAITVAGDVEGIEIRAPLRRTLQITGTVLASDGTPARGARVSAAPVSDRARFAIEARPAGGDGSFSFAELMPGRYRLSARVTGGDSAAGGEWGEIDVDLSSEDASGVRLALVPPLTVNGRITYDDKEPPGDPPPVVTVQSASRGFFSLRETRPEVTEDLRFEMRGITGPQVVTVGGLPGGWVVDAIRYRGADITGVPTTFASGSDEVEIVLTSKTARVRGRVLDGRGDPVANTVVILIPADRTPPPGRQAWTVAHAGEDGTFSAPAVPARDYLVLALTRRDFEDVADDPPSGLFERLAERLQLTENERRVMDLRVRIFADDR